MGALLGLKLTTDRHPPITSQTRYPLCHAALSALETSDTHATLVPYLSKDREMKITFISFFVLHV